MEYQEGDSGILKVSYWNPKCGVVQEFARIE